MVYVVQDSMFPTPQLAQWDYTWPIKRTPVFKTIKQPPANNIGEVRVSLTPFALWHWELDIAYLKGDAVTPGGNTPWHQIVGFYGQMKGAAVPWFYLDPYDNGIDSAGNPITWSLGVGDGVTTAFQMTRNVGGLVDLIQSFNGTPTVSLAGVSVPSGGVAAPGAPSLSQVAGGSLGATTYFVKLTFQTQSGESLVGAEASLAVSANNLLQVTSPAKPSNLYLGYNVYISTSSGTETKQNAPFIPFGTNFTEPTSGLAAGSQPPASNTTGWSIDNFGMLTFTGVPVLSTPISWAGQFFFRCFFDDDNLPLSQDLYRIWSVKTLKFTSAYR